MKKYYYAKMSTDTYPHELSNEFLYLLVYFGAYLVFNSKKNYISFQNFIANENLTYNKLSNQAYPQSIRWSYLNKASIFFRNLLKETDNISRRELRKFGYSGPFSVPMYPRKGCTIQSIVFDYIFTKQEYEPVKFAFLTYIYDKWKATTSDQVFIDLYTGPTAHKNVFAKFISFQYDLLSSFKDGYAIKNTLCENNTYKYIKSAILDKEEGGNNIAWK